MKILIVSTLKRPIKPDYFASRSRIIFEIADGLVKKGHEVHVLGTGDSEVPGATIIPVIEKGWVDMPPAENSFQQTIGFLQKQTAMLLKIQDQYDVIHNHTYPDFFPSVIEHSLTTPLVTTMHALYDYYMDDVLSRYPKTHFISLSDAYQKLYTKTRFFRTVYNGMDPEVYSFHPEKSDYLFWLGRLPKGKNQDGTFIDPKGVRWAIKLAQETDSKLFISAPVEDLDFYKTDIEPHLNDKIQFVGNPTSEQSVPIEKIIELYQNAKAFLMTVNQHEPFGLVMTEAMSCGTPVIGFDRGSVPEVIADGKTGFVVPYNQGVSGLKEALNKIDQIRPEDCRQHVLDHFSLEKMVEGYEKVYTDAIAQSK